MCFAKDHCAKDPVEKHEKSMEQLPFARWASPPLSSNFRANLLGEDRRRVGRGCGLNLVCVCESQCVRSDETDSFVITYTPPCLQGVKSLHPPPCHCVSLTYTLNHQLEQIGWAFQRIPSKRCISKKGARGINLSYPKCCVGPS